LQKFQGEDIRAEELTAAGMRKFKKLQGLYRRMLPLGRD
jgi:hypothetical protein